MAPENHTVAGNEPEDDLSGRRLGDYHILRRLGHGGMASVYLAQQTSLGRKVAFKVLKRQLTSDANAVQRFRKEAQAAARLNHANIVQIIEIGCVDGINFIVMEYVAGNNLRQLIARRDRPVDARLAVALMRQVLSALHSASQQGIVHRDIKPENIMLSSTGDAKVADFGLARMLDDVDVNLTKTGMTMGTPLYMSPEQIEANSFDQRSDIYSFGVTCYHMLAGRAPFMADAPLAVAMMHLRDDPEPLEAQRPDLPKRLCQIVMRMMARSPGDRYQRAAEVVQDLQAVAVQEGGDNWSVDLPTRAELPSSGTLSDVTESLQTIMNDGSVPSSRGSGSGYVLWFVVVTITGLLLGGMAGWLTRPAPLP